MLISTKNIEESAHKTYDVIVVGGGAGGLAAGIYLQRYFLDTLIIDKGKARSFWMQELHNYLGLSPDTPGRVLLQKGKEHFLSVNGDLLNGYVEEIVDEGNTFAVKVKVGRQNSIYPVFRCKYLIAASGIIDYLPVLDNMKNVYEYAGYNLHVCMICDGYEIKDTRCGLFVNREENINTAFVLSWFTQKITIFTNGLFKVSEEMKSKIASLGYTLEETPLKQFLGKNHQMSGVELSDGRIINLDTGLISMGSHYHSTYLDSIDLEKKGGNLVTDKTGRTSHPRIFAIGDLKVGLNQVIIAAGDGALAATTIWQEIRASVGAKPLISE
jgi:thioredoxin reductase (NADPH)